MKAELQVQDLGGQLAKNFSIAQLNGSIAADSRELGVKDIQGVMQGIRFEAQGAVDLEAGARVTNLTMADDFVLLAKRIGDVRLHRCRLWVREN